MTIDPTFDRQLLRLVRRRNEFVHKLALRQEFNSETNAHWHHNVARLKAALTAFGAMRGLRPRPGASFSPSMPALATASSSVPPPAGSRESAGAQHTNFP
jgi:hypothetical protein